MQKLKWHFAESTEQTGPTPGLQVEVKGKPKVVATDLAQNSNDAIGKGSDCVKFSVRYGFVPREAVPGLDQLIEHLRRVKTDFADKAKTVEACDDLLSRLDRAKINVVMFDDTGTTGAKLSKFNALIHGEGISDKDSENAHGCHGIGKSAIWGPGRVAMFSTRTEEGETFCVGKAYLPSHKLPNGRFTNAYGYFGEDAMGYITDFRHVNNHWRKADIGTSIFVLGAVLPDNWQSVYTDAIIEVFFTAILKGRLNIEIDNTQIGHNELRAMLSKEKSFRGQLYRAMLRPDHKIEGKIDGLGRYTLRLKHEPDAKNKVAIMRDGMLVDTMSIGGQLSPLAGVFELLDPIGNLRVREFESPFHDKIHPGPVRDAIRKTLTAETLAIAKKPSNIDFIERGMRELWVCMNGDRLRLPRTREIDHLRWRDQGKPAPSRAPSTRERSVTPPPPPPPAPEEQIVGCAIKTVRLSGDFQGCRMRILAERPGKFLLRLRTSEIDGNGSKVNVMAARLSDGTPVAYSGGEIGPIKYGTDPLELDFATDDSTRYSYNPILVALEEVCK